MNDIVFTEPELLALRRHALRQAWGGHSDRALGTDAWQSLAEKLAEAARQAGAVQAAHATYLAHMNAKSLAADANRRRYDAEG